MSFNHSIFRSRAFETLLALVQKEKKEVYLVGGFLRDLILGRRREALDLDFSMPAGAIDFGRRLARALKCGFVVLDREHGCSRVVWRAPDRAPVTFDFADFRAKTLKGDLRERDFTINTLAARLALSKTMPGAWALGDGDLVDFYGARRDIEQKVIRAVDAGCFDDDPLRVLRAFSLAAIFDFKIEPKTFALVRAKKELLKNMAGERARDELFKILGSDDASRHIRALDKNKVLAVVIPQVTVMHNVKQGGYHHLDVWGHSLETVEKLEELMAQLKDNADVASYLDETMAGDRKRRQFLKLAALLHDIGKPKAHEVKAGKTMFHGHERIGRVISDAVADRLKLSTRERYAFDTIIFWHLRPGYLADNAVLTPRAVHRYFRDTEEEAVSVLLISIADQRATRGPLATPASRLKHEKVSFSLIDEYFRRLKEKPMARLIGGDDLIKKLRLKPGPLFSVILDAVFEAQVEGRLATKKEALVFARDFAAREAFGKREKK